VLKGWSLDAAEAEGVIGEILDDVVPDTLVAGFLVALKMEDEATAELTASARLKYFTPLSTSTQPRLKWNCSQSSRRMSVMISEAGSQPWESH
jgi:anthranilate phosphoribosyltransferase